MLRTQRRENRERDMNATRLLSTQVGRGSERPQGELFCIQHHDDNRSAPSIAEEGHV